MVDRWWLPRSPRSTKYEVGLNVRAVALLAAERIEDAVSGPTGGRGFSLQIGMVFPAIS